MPDLNGALAMAYAERSDYKAAKASVDSLVAKVAAARGAGGRGYPWKEPTGPELPPESRTMAQYS